MFLAEFLLPLLVKMALTALIVVSASVAAERAGPAVGGVILSLPVAAGPAYFFLALQAEDAFVAGSAFYSFAAQAATVLFIAAYARIAPRLGAAASLAAATAVWFAVVLLARALAAGWWAVLALNALAFVAAFPLAGRPGSAPCGPAAATSPCARCSPAASWPAWSASATSSARRRPDSASSIR